MPQRLWCSYTPAVSLEMVLDAMTLAVAVDLRNRFWLQTLEPRTETTMTDEKIALIELV